WSLNFVGSSSGRGATSARAGVLPSACTRHSAYSWLSMKSTKTLAAFGCGAFLTTANSGDCVLTQPGSRQSFVIGTVPRLYSARHLAGLVESEQLGLEPGELANEAFAVLLRVHVLQPIDVVGADVGDARIGERHALALDEVDPVGVAHEIPVALGVFFRRDQLGVDVQAADAREDAGQVRLLVHDGPAPLHARVERRGGNELLAQATPGEGPTALPAA